LLGAVAKSAVDDRIPCASTVEFGGALADDVDDPSRWLVCDGVELVPMSSVDLPAQVDVLEKEVAVINTA
jgi:hypothetical protein